MTRAQSSEEPLLGGHAGRQLFLVTGGTMTFTTGRFVLPPLLPTIIDTLSITTAEAGVALSLMFGLTALFRYPGGRLSDDLTRKTVIVGSLAVLAMGFVLLAVVDSYVTFLAGVTVTGIGVGLYTAAAVAHLSDLYVERRGQALGVNNSSVYVAGVLGAVVANAALAQDEWRAAFGPIAVVLTVLLGAFHSWSRDRYAIGRPRLDIGETVGRLLRSTRIRRMLVVGALFGIAWQGVITFLPTFLQSEKSVPPSLASNLFALLFSVGVGANLVGGRLADRFEVPWLIAGVSGLATVGLAVVILAGSTPIIVGGVVTLGAGLASIWPVLQSYLMELLPADSKGGDYGAFSAGYIGIASIGPGLVGLVAGRLGFTAAFVGLAGCLLLSTTLALRFEG